ncbi:MAG: putative sulfate exporter family transporter [Acidobacteriota bacterium]
MLAVMTAAGMAMRANVPRFMIGFSVIFWLSIACYFVGHYAYIAATKNEMAKYGLPWTLSLTGEFGFIIALVVGLLIGNFFPKFADWLKEAARPELFIKTGIVIMGAGLGLKAAESFGLATNIMFRGFCAIVEAYLIYWALTYYIARKYFKFSREWSAPLASGISICGVSAAIATGGAIRARPIVPIMVSSLVVIFVAIEMIILPFMAQAWLWAEPLVAGAWMGLAVKSDGGAIASGAITDALIRAKAMDMTGVNYVEGWITMTATTVKMFIDIFIGVWSFLLAIIWCAKIDCKEGQKVRAIEIWNRFPKFVIGYAATLVLLLLICWPAARTVAPADKEIGEIKQVVAASEKQLPAATDDAQKAALQAKIADGKKRIADITASSADARKTMSLAKLSTDEGNVFRVFFFLLTFFAIGLVSNFKKLMEEGIGKLAAVYVVCLFGFIIWIGLFISWLFFHGVLPPVVVS